MDLNAGDMQADILRELGQNGTMITLRWNEVAAGATPDPVDGTLPASALIPQTAVAYAFIHQIAMAGRSGVKQFNEVEEGDLILDFGPDVPLDPPSLAVSSGAASARDLVFLVPIPGGQKAYVAKDIPEKLAQSWDVTVQGRQLMRSVLVRVKT
jgi:hypothetical protein